MRRESVGLIVIMEREQSPSWTHAFALSPSACQDSCLKDHGVAEPQVANPAQRRSSDTRARLTRIEGWRALVDAQKRGKLRSIGVSNFSPNHIEGIAKATGVWPVSVTSSPADACERVLTPSVLRVASSAHHITGREPGRASSAEPATGAAQVLQGAQRAHHRVQPARQQRRRQAEAR